MYYGLLYMNVFAQTSQQLLRGRYYFLIPTSQMRTEGKHGEEPWPRQAGSQTQAVLTSHFFVRKPLVQAPYDTEGETEAQGGIMAFPSQSGTLQSLLVTSSVLPGLWSVMGTPWGPFPSRSCPPGQAQAPPVEQMTQRAGTTFPHGPALSRCSEDAELSGRTGGNSSE